MREVMMSPDPSLLESRTQALHMLCVSTGCPQSSSLYFAQILGDGALPSSLFTEKSLLQQVPTGTIRFVVPANGRGAYFIGTSTGQIQSVPPTASATLGAQTQTFQATKGGLPLLAVGGAGRRVVYLDGQGQPLEVLFTNVQGCMAGYVPTKLNIVSEGICMQAGRGFYTDANGQLQSCPPGTYGPTAGAHQGCIPCPPGTYSDALGSAVCLPRPMFSS